MPRLPEPEVPELHRMGNGQTVIRYMGVDARGFKTVRNHKLGTVERKDAEHTLTSFTKEWKKMQANGEAMNGSKSTPEQRAKWAKEARDKRAKKKQRKIPRGATLATDENNQAPGTALVAVVDDSHADAQRTFYKKRKQEAEQGKASTEAIRRINEHVGVLAANLEVAGRTLKMITRMISELELEP